MNFYESLFSVVQHDYDVSQDDPYYSNDNCAIERIEQVLAKIKYKPYLDWIAELGAKEEKERKEREARRAQSPNVTHRIDSSFGNMSPAEIMRMCI